MFKIISAVFSTGFAVGAASALLALHRGHIELPGDQPAPTDDEAVDAKGDAVDAVADGSTGNGSDQESGPEDSFPADADRVGS